MTKTQKILFGINLLIEVILLYAFVTKKVDTLSFVLITMALALNIVAIKLSPRQERR